MKAQRLPLGRCGSAAAFGMVWLGRCLWDGMALSSMLQHKLDIGAKAMHGLVCQDMLDCRSAELRGLRVGVCRWTVEHRQ